MKPQESKNLFRVCAILLTLPVSILSQQYSISDIVVVNGGVGHLSHRTYSTTLIVGQTFVGAMSSAEYSTAFGFWGFYLKEPGPPLVSASDGDYANAVEITWELDVLSPPAIGPQAYNLFRDGMALATQQASRAYYSDDNVFPGLLYTYDVYVSNQFGQGEKGSDIGFVNPNGIISGHIETPNSVPVPGVEVSLSPNLGQALSFDGSDDYVAIPSSTSLYIGTNKVTLEAWVKLDILPTNLSGNYASIYDSYEDSYIFYKDKENNELRFKVTDSDGTAEAPGIPGSTLETGTWLHIAGVYDGDTGTAKIYLDGQLVDTHTNANLTGYVKSGQVATIGSLAGSSNFFQGKIDEVRIWNAARTQEEIQMDMNRTLGGSETGLRAYWKFDEGTGELVFDMTDNDNDGVIYDAQWTNDTAPVQTSAFTDENGNYIIEGIYYGTSSNFTVTPYKNLHSFQPQSRLVTLSTSNSAINGVDFTDNSMISVSGHIIFNNTSCYVEGVEILVNGASANPPSFTDSVGAFVVEFEPEASATISPSLNGHSFTPGFFQFENISTPIAGKTFYDTQTYSLSGFVGGGECKLPMPPSEGEITVSITSTPSCFDTTVTTTNDGRFNVVGLAPLHYFVSIDHPDQVIGVTFQDVMISLEDSSQVLDFIYRAPLEVEITGFSENTCGVTVLEQFESCEITINVFERYGNNICDLDSGVVSIFDYISGIGEITVPFFEGFATYTFEAGMPNILTGGDHPFQKQIQVVATDIDGRSATTDYWVYVEGERPREQTFTTVSPEIPLFILRDPPGDGSFSFLSQDSSICTNVSFSREDTKGGTGWFEGQLGYGLESNAFTGAYGFYATLGYTGTFEEGEIRAGEREVCFTVSETFYTSGEDVIGPEGDVFVGGAINMLYALTDVITYDRENCVVVRDTSLGMMPNGFETTFIYTDIHIRETLLPDLEFLAATTSDSDSAMLYLDAIEVWQQTLAMNDSLKSIADFSENISFSGGLSYDYSIETSLDTSWSIEFDTYIEDEIAWSANIVLGDFNSIRGGGQYRWRINEGNSKDTTLTTTNVVGFTLTDDDVGDFFSVNIKKDPVYGTPVFETVSGESSCPWEANTVPREGVQLTMDHVMETHVPPDDPAVFMLYLGNTSQTDDEVEYYLSVIQASNPYGVTVKIGGVLLEDFLSYTIPAGTQLEATMTVERGPVEYNYDSLQVELYSPCDDQIADTVTFYVHFLTPCTEVTIANPDDNWVINQSNSDTLWVTITSYDTTHPSFQGIDLEYRSITGSSFSRNVNGESGFFSYSDNKTSNINILNESNNPQVPNKTTKSQLLPAHIMQSGGQTKRSGMWQAHKGLKEMTGLPRSIPVSQDFTRLSAIGVAQAGNDRMTIESRTNRDDGWIIAYSIEKESLTSSYVIVPWDVQYLDDGNYEIRAVASCSGDIISTDDPVSGIIDRSPPQVFGTPQPSDGVLNPNDEISITFEETINCNLINPNSLLVEFVSTGQEIDNEVSCSDNMLYIVADIQNRFIENQILRVTLSGIMDLYGNEIDEPVVWEFFVDRNPVRWSGGDINVQEFIDEPLYFTRQLFNTGGTPYSFSIIDYENWITPSPREGQISAGGSETITFEISEQLASGIYLDTLYASTQMGDEPLVVDLRVLCYPPIWEVNPTDYQYSMTITANLLIEDEMSTDIFDIVAAFVDNELRGMANVQYIPTLDTYEVFLTIYSNTVLGENISFRVWDASECIQLGHILEEFVFDASAIWGSPEDPVTLSATNEIIQHIDFAKGWTWFSLNLEPPDMSINTVLGDMSLVTGDLINSQIAYDQYVEGYGWIGTLDTLDNKSMYQTKLTKANTQQIIGYPVDVDQVTIPIVEGWNWISYLPQTGIDINKALSSLDATTGDLIKSQFAYAQYLEGTGWIGSLLFLNPKIGYLLYTQNSGILIYPSGESVMGSTLARSSLLSLAEDGPDWSVNPHDYEYTMTVTGMIQFHVEGIESDDSLDVIAAFVGDQCRGVGHSVYVSQLDRYIVFLMTYSNVKEGEKVEFKVFDGRDNYVWNVSEYIEFRENSIIRSVEDPFKWTTRPLGIGDPGYVPHVYSLGQNFPNPFNPITKIGYGLPEDSDVTIRIYNIIGQEVETLISERKTAGYQYVLWNSTDRYNQPVSTGVYIVVMDAHSIQGTSSFRQIRKMILLK